MIRNTSLEIFRRKTIESKANGSRDDSGTKLGEEDPGSELAEYLQPAKDETCSNHILNDIRFNPKIIEFVDAFQGKQFFVKIHIQNIGRNPVKVKLGEPKSFIFQLKKPIRRAKLLAPGSSITRTVTYSYHNDDLVRRSHIPVQINGFLLDYPIVVRKAKPVIYVEPEKLDFKVINMGASAKTLMLTIRNSGGKRTRFDIDLGKNDLDLVVNPIRGTIRAKEDATVLVEMMGTFEGDYYKELWITTSEAPIRIPILVEVVRPRLQIVLPKGTEDFSLINLRPTFNGSQSASSFILKNYSAETTFFVVVAEVNGELEFLKEARKSHNTLSMFMLTAEEGRLEPFECRVITVLFRPKLTTKKKGWIHEEKDKKKTQWEHIVFIRINRVHCIERKELVNVEIPNPPIGSRDRGDSVMDSNHISPGYMESIRINRTSDYVSQILESTSTERINSFPVESPSREENALRLCLHGKSVIPDILIQPTDFFFGSLLVRETSNKVLRITNASPIRVKYKLLKLMNVEVKPTEGWLKPEEAHEVLFSLTPRCAGRFRCKLIINLLAESDVVFNDDNSMETISTMNVPFFYHAHDRVYHPEPTISNGLSVTPSRFTYKEAFKLPPSAFLSSLKGGVKPKWMKKELDKNKNLDNVLVALPNDRPTNLAWPKKKVCRTIFKGLLRYSPPEDLTYTFVEAELAEKKRKRASWEHYLRSLAGENFLQRFSEYQLGCRKHYKMEDYKPDLTFVSVTANKEAFKKFDQKKEIRPLEAFVPLSPMFLSRIHVEPKFINFGMIAPNTEMEESLIIQNKNPFPISIRFIPGKSAVTIIEGNTIDIRSLSIKSVKISFQAKDLGRHNGYLDYVINGSHEFRITISAVVTPKTLIVKPEGEKLEDGSVTVEFGKHSQNRVFQPTSSFVYLQNSLQSPIKYRWSIPGDICYVAKVVEGEIPPTCRVVSQIAFELNPRMSFYGEVKLISESGSCEMLKLIYHHKKVAVNFQSNRIDMQDISLNLPTIVKPIIENACYHDVSFIVTNWNPMPGVVVEPTEGIIKARSFFPLKVTVKIPVIMKFSFDIVLLVHVINRISVKITGNVVVPLISLKPSEIIMRKICAQSFDTVMICATNEGTTPAELAIDLTECPEYRVVDDRRFISLPPKKSTKFVIHFEPNDVARYVFYLPVTINKILGPPMIQQANSELISHYLSDYESNYLSYGEVFQSKSSNKKIPCVCLNSTVTPSLLKISSLMVNFTMAKKTAEVSCLSWPQTVIFSNDFVDSVTFCIRNDDLGEENDSPFKLVPLEENDVEYRMKSMKACLKMGQKLILKGYFEPKKPGIYRIEVPIFVRGYNNGVVYNYITMKGELKQPRIYPEATEIHFSPLPLEVGCDATLSICAVNYTSKDTINCFFWDSREGLIASNLLTFTWMTEPIIKCNKETEVLQLQITFRSSTPVALRGYLLFLDSKSEYCSVLITAVSDNSVLTTHAFLTSMSSKYRLVRDTPAALQWVAEDEVILPFPFGKSILNVTNDPPKTQGPQDQVLNTCQDKGPKLVIQVTKSMSKSTQLGFANLTKNPTECKPMGSSTTVLGSSKIKALNSDSSQADNQMATRLQSVAPLAKRSDPTNELTYPNFPGPDSVCRTHFQQTIKYVERWMYEVVMRCDQYFVIPQSFQTVKVRGPSSEKTSGEKLPKSRTERDFLNFLEEVIGREPSLPKRYCVTNPSDRLELHYCFFADILCFLQYHGCRLPHLRPEYLFDYEDYVQYTEAEKITETLEWRSVTPQKPVRDATPSSLATVKVKAARESIFRNSSYALPKITWKKSLFRLESEVEVDKPEEKPDEVDSPGLPTELESVRHLFEGVQFRHEMEIFDKTTFEARSTQAWLDIILQIYRNFVLTKIVYKNTIPQVTKYEMEDKLPVEIVELRCLSCPYEVGNPLPESHDSNLYTIQERALLSWLNHHLHIQKDILWQLTPNERIINNFDKDLADAVALISVTATHCPYIVSRYFDDVFFKADTLTKMYHNAGKLAMAWKEIGIGLTVEASDIVSPNPVFMIIVVAQLYEILPTLHPHSLIHFSAPLSSETTRTILLKNESRERIHFEGKFLGDDSNHFRLGDSSLIEVLPQKVKELVVIFTAKKIKTASATLILIGCFVSPSFAKNITFYLEGEPSELTEKDIFSVSAPLYEMMCIEIPVKPPYSEPTTYEIWFTTIPPVNKDFSVLVKPWSKLWNRKIPRRLFLYQTEILVDDMQTPPLLGITVTCLTEENRNFWLLFRSNTVGDFIIMIETKSKPSKVSTPIFAYYSELWVSPAECSCKDRNRELKCNSVNPMNCPFFTQLKIPRRNEALWSALLNTFFKGLNPLEKSFWAEHFETNIGLCVILWLLSPDEEEGEVNEFVHLLPTKVSYILRVEPPNDQYVNLPKKIEIPDVRERSYIAVPMHISSDAPPQFNLLMTSENGKEVRSFRVMIQPPEENLNQKALPTSLCPPISTHKVPAGPCKKSRKTKKNASTTSAGNNLDRCPKPLPKK